MLFQVKYTDMSEEEIQKQMDAMRALDEPMPQVGIFWYDMEDKSFFGVWLIHNSEKTESKILTTRVKKPS